MCVCFIHVWVCLRMWSVVYPKIAILRWKMMIVHWNSEVFGFPPKSSDKPE